MKNKLSIKVSIAGRSYPLTIERDEEEGVRAAAKSINEKLSEYEKGFGIKDRQDLLAMCCIFFASNSQESLDKENKKDKSLLAQLEKIEDSLSEALE